MIERNAPPIKHFLTRMIGARTPTPGFIIFGGFASARSVRDFSARSVRKWSAMGLQGRSRGLAAVRSDRAEVGLDVADGGLGNLCYGAKFALGGEVIGQAWLV